MDRDTNNWILFNEADREASIYTFNADLKRRLRGCHFAGVQRAAAFCAGYRGAAALLGSRGNAHWRVKGGSPYRVKGETPCPARVGACANSYWVYCLTLKLVGLVAKAVFLQSYACKKRKA